MSQRRYQLLCPVARALDVLGDRWTLLILRDLHAGPARFQELQEGLGMATNLLSTRLGELTGNGLVHRLGADRQAPYGLTDLGRSTDRLLWELVAFGSRIDRPPEPRTPGNLRTIALPLRLMLEAVPDRPTLRVRLHVDDDAFDIVTGPGNVRVELATGPSTGSTADGPAPEADLVVRTDYEGFLDLAEGRIDLEEFGQRHRRVERGDPDALTAFGELMAAALGAVAPGSGGRPSGPMSTR